MKHIFLTLVLVSAFKMHSAAYQSENVDVSLTPLSAKEADAIIQEEERAKADEKARRRARLLDQSKFQVIEQTEISAGEDRITLNRVSPPLLDQPTPALNATEPIQPQRQFSEAEMQRMLLEYLHQDKEQRTLMLSATVYDRKLTRLQWHHEGQQYVAWSNIDFNYLRGLTEIETEEANYLFLLGIGNESTEETKEQIRFAEKHNLQINRENPIPELPDFTRGRYEYFVIASSGSAARQKAAYIPIDALHDYYAENKKRLEIQYQRSEALNEARERYREQYPEEPEDAIINFWPGRGSVYQNQPKI